MKKSLLIFFVLISLNSFSQINDTIILKTGEIIPCQIGAISKSGVVTYYYIDNTGNSVMSQKSKTFIQEIKKLDRQTRFSEEPGAENWHDTVSGGREENYIITLTHKTKPNVKYITTGKKVTIWLAAEKIKGRITSITPDSLYIDSLAYSPGQIIKIRAFFPEAAIGGAFLTAGAIGAATVGTGASIGLVAAIVEFATWEIENEAMMLFLASAGLIFSVPLTLLE